MNLTDMIGAEARQRSGDAALGTCTDLLIDTANKRIEYVLFNATWGFAHHPIVVARARVTWSGDAFIVDLSDAELEARHERAAGPDADGPLDLSSMPPVVVGPFGYTVAPVMAAALMNTAAEGTHGGTRPAIDEKHRDWHWFGTLKGLPIFDSSGPLGDLADIIVKRDTLDCVSLVADKSGRRALFPFDKLRHVTRDDRSIVLELSSTPPYAAGALRDT